MNFPLLHSCGPGDNYLVDLGRLVQVSATSPMDAYLIASTAVFGAMPQCPPEHPMVYQIDQHGELIAVFD
ncbi:MAG TPA: hypothetical protein VGK36_08970 [Candidatus Angelobacter sp.]|jgi:hypothetical protein